MDPSPSHDATSSTCFSGILRRLLCSGAHPTHPSDTIVGGSTRPQLNRADEVSKPGNSGTSPGIVARLMGLESLPEPDSVTRRRTLESILRSRSVNSVNYLPEFDLLNTQHRRAKTSVSFREIPTFINEPNHDFVVLCFEKVGERKSDMGFETEWKQRKGTTEKTERKQILPPRNRDAVETKSSEKLAKKRRRRRRKKSNRKSETGNPTAPVSVLHVSKSRLPERSRKPVSSSRRSSRKEELEFDEYPHQNYADIDEEDKPRKAKEATGDENHAKLIEQIRSLSQEHMDRDSKWAAKRFVGFEEFEEICNEFGQQLLDHLIQQVVVELSRIFPESLV